MYKCTVVPGCEFEADSFHEYLKHLRVSHFSAKELECKQRGCSYSASSYQLIIKLISNIHWRRAVTSPNNFTSVASITCPIGGCGSQKLQTLKEINVHICTHFADNQKVICPFKNCNFEYANKSILHIPRK